MQIQVLGTRGEIKTSSRRHYNHSGILIDGKILIDVGEEKYLRHKPEIILITHLHPDHAFFVSKRETTNVKAPVYSPETTSKVHGIKILSGPLLIGDYRIIPIPVVHSLKVKSQGYVIEKGSKRIFYSGDIVEIRKRYLPQLAHLDAVITEASFIRKGGLVRRTVEGQKFGHAGVRDLIELFKPLTSRIILTHFGTWFIKHPETGKQKLQILEQPNFKIDIAFDGVQYYV